MKAKVSKRAVEGRLRRHLANEGLALRKCREGTRSYDDLGDYYTVSIDRNCIVDRNIDLESCSREAGLLKQFEELVAE